MTKVSVLGLLGSPRHDGNSDIMLDEALKGAAEAGAEIAKISLYDIDFSGCIECNDCMVTGECSITDDMDPVYKALEKADRIVLAAPMFFMSLPAQAKAMVDRSQCYWALKYVLKEDFPREPGSPRRYGAFIGVGGTRGEKLFDGTILTLKYFFDAIDVEPLEDRYVFVRNVEDPGDVRKHEDALEAARSLGKYLAGLE